MRKLLPRRPSGATVLVGLALFFALGGTAGVADAASPPSAHLLQTGVWAANGTTAPAYAAISFVHPLHHAPTVHLIGPKQKTPMGCAGDVAHPGAKPGNLCVFARFLFHSKFGGIFNPGGSSTYIPGAVLFLDQKKSGHFDGAGTWAVRS